MNVEQVKSKFVNVLIAIAAVLAVVSIKPPIPVVVPPITPPAVVTPDVPPAPLAVPELVIVTDSAGKRIVDAAVEAVAGNLAVGSWRIVAVPKPGDVGWSRVLTVSEGAVVPQPPVVVVPPPIQPEPPTPAPVAATAATYVYEKSDTAIPSAVMSALNRLNRERKIVATVFEVDATDGSGEVPQQYKTAAAAARQAGLPALVVTSGESVLKVLKDPRTLEAVMGAVP